MSRFINDSKIVFLGQIIQLVFNLGTSVLIARLLGVEDRGLLALVLIFPAVIQMMCAGGASSTIIYAVSKGTWNKDNLWSNLIGLYLILMLSILVMGVPLAILVKIYWLSLVGVHLFFLVLLQIPIALASKFLLAVFSGKRLFNKIVFYNIFSSSIYIFFLIIFLVLYNLGIKGIIFAQIFSSIICFGYLVYKVNIYGFSIKNNRCFPNFRLRSEVVYGLKLQFSNFATFLSYKADQGMLGNIMGSTSVGVYVISVSLAEKLWLLTQSIPQVILPATAELKEKDRYEFACYIGRVASLCLFALFFSSLIMALFSPLIIILLFGSAYKESAKILIYLLPGIVILGHSRILSNYLAGAGYPGVNAARSWCALILNIILNLILIPLKGPVGAAIATSISYSLSSLSAAFIFSKITKVRLIEIFIPQRDDIKKIISFIIIRIFHPKLMN